MGQLADKQTHGSHPGGLHTYLCLSFCVFMLSTAFSFAANLNTEEIQKSHELDNLRTRIRTVENSIDQARSDIDELYRELRQNESAAGQLAGQIQQLQVQIDAGKAELDELKEKKLQQESILSEQRQHLGQQIRAAYKTGRNNYLQLLLNQQSPDRVGRVLAYYNYDVQARGRRIHLIKTSLQEIARLEETIRQETEALVKLQEKHRTQLSAYHQHRQSREAVRARLEAYVLEQGTQLQVLQENEKQLSRLVEELKEEDLAMRIFEDMPPFETLRGQLDWPVEGSISARFGSLRKGGKLKRHGVTIDADSGDEVRAITAGKVIFADWFRNMGLLMILDHGDGFMSLYGHNERLLKKPGDWVLAGDVISRVGDSGGQNRPALYFEIRQGGNPVNPALWCRK